MLRRVTILEDHDDACFELSYDHEIDFTVLLFTEAPGEQITLTPTHSVLATFPESYILSREAVHTNYYVICLDTS